MKIQFVLVLLMLIAFQACDNDPQPVPVAFFTASASNDYLDYYDYDDFWVFATDDAGKVLDAQPLTAGATVMLATPNPPGLFNLSVCNLRESGGGFTIHAFETYAGIANGAHITFEPPGDDVPSPPILGLATITLENCPPLSYFTVSDGFTFIEDYSFESTTKSTPLNIREGYPKVLISTRKAIDQPLFGWIENVVSPGTFTIDMSDLTAFPNTVSVSHTGLGAAILLGHESGRAGDGFAMAAEGFGATSGPAETIELGYLDDFDSYSLDLFTATELSTFGRYALYSKAGSTLPATFTFPDNTLQIAEPSIKSFAFTYSSAFTRANHEWAKDAGNHVLSWRIHSESNQTPSISELPASLTAKYPYLSLDNLAYQNSQIYNHVDGYTYEQFLDEPFGAQPPATHEFYLDIFLKR